MYWYELLGTQYFLIRQLAKDLPRAKNHNTAMRIRALATRIATTFPPFMENRIKIHGSSDPTGVQRVEGFRDRYEKELPPAVDQQLQALAQELESAYAETGQSVLGDYLSRFPAHTPMGYQIRRIVAAADQAQAGESQSRHLAHLLYMIRKDVSSLQEPEERLALIDLSIDAESLLFQVAAQWQPKTVGALLVKNYILAKAAAGCGFIEIWEWEFLEPKLYPMLAGGSFLLDDFLTRVEYSLRAVEWGVGSGDGPRGLRPDGREVLALRALGTGFHR